MKEVVSNPSSIISLPIISTTPTTAPPQPHTTTKAVSELCHNIEGNINVGSFSRLIYEMMLAWERPSYYDEEDTTENVAKEKEERKITLNTTQEQDDIPLFYSHVNVTNALEMMVRMTHGGACG
ncbi:hypothetical protein JHK82_055043 [Glycine max]|nr:hypothetical protein JHK82_055043 [Glycine max]